MISFILKCDYLGQLPWVTCHRPYSLLEMAQLYDLRTCKIACKVNIGKDSVGTSAHLDSTTENFASKIVKQKHNL